MVLVTGCYLWTIARNVDVEDHAIRIRQAAIAPWEASEDAMKGTTVDIHQVVLTRLESLSQHPGMPPQAQSDRSSKISKCTISSMSTVEASPIPPAAGILVRFEVERTEEELESLCFDCNGDDAVSACTHSSFRDGKSE